MFPHDAGLLRCHPYWGQLRSPVSDGHIHTNSHRKLSWVCCECSIVFFGAPRNITRGTCRCTDHSKPFRKCDRPRYLGSIPMLLTDVIRVGLLQSVDNKALVNTVASMIQHDEDCARDLIYEVSQYTKHQLLDGGFWWEDSSQRKNGIRYKSKSHCQKRPRAAERQTGNQFNHLSNGVICQLCVCMSAL